MMSKMMKWNDFVAAHPKAICVSTAFTWKIPAGALSPVKGLKMPSGYKMLLEVLALVLTGDWTARSVTPPRTPQKAVKGRKKQPLPVVIQIVVVHKVDLIAIGKKFQVGPVTGTTLPAPCAAAFQFPYDPSDYDSFAKALGYV